MTTTLEDILQAAQQLSATEKLTLIHALSHDLLAQQRPEADQIPAHIARSAPVTDISALAASFWPADESADDINTFIAQQRRDDREHEL